MILAGTLMLPEGPTRVRLAGGWLRVEGGRIAEVHEGDRSPTPDLGGDERVIVPGFVDAHVHLPQFDAIGADGLTLLDWLERVIYPAEARWADADFAAERTGRAIARMISHGTTAFAAFATVHQDAAHRAGRMALESGVRCAIGQVLMDQQAPAEFCRPVNQLINEVRRTLATEPSDRVAFAVAPRFAIACSGRLLEAAGRLARETGAMVQTHLAETPQEARHVRELHGKPYTQVYHDAGLLSRRSVLGHGLWLAEEDRALLASREAIIAHCPTANTFLQSGVMDRAAHHAAGVRVALGSDVAGGPDVSMVPVVRAMVEAEAEADGFVGIGYQWSYSEAIQALKRDVMVGTLGAPVRMRTKVLWPRPLSYYGRSSWAARIKTDAGDWVLDSPVMNATAHYLHNCFYVLGETRESSTMPMDVEAELYRANEIENYDTAAIRCHTESGVEILYYAAHPVSETIGPVLRYEFEDAVVAYEGPGDSIVATFDDGRIVDYGDPFANNRRKLWQAADAVRTGTPMACGITTASAHTLCTNGAQESGWPIVDFPEERLQRQPIREGEDTLVWVEGLQETLERAYDGGSLPSELGAVDWARLGDRLSLEGYTRFPSVIGVA